MKKDIKDFTSKELEAEISRRETIARKQLKPLALPCINWLPLIEYMEEIVDNVDESEDGYPGKDYENYLMETVVECIYGKGFWDWWNKNANY